MLTLIINKVLHDLQPFFIDTGSPIFRNLLLSTLSGIVVDFIGVTHVVVLKGLSGY